MTTDHEDQLRALFASAGHDLPPEAFTAGVTARLSTPRRRLALHLGAGVLTTVVILLLLAPDLARGALALNGFPGLVRQLAVRSLPLLSESSLPSFLYVYAGVFAGSFFLKALKHFRIRWV